MIRSALFTAAFFLASLAGAQIGLETLGKRVVPTGYSYVGITGTPNADQNVWTMVCLSCTTGASSTYQGTYDIYLVPHGGTGEFMFTSSTTPPLTQGFPISQSKTSETGGPVNSDQILWIRGGGYWDIMVGWMKTLVQ